jgi:hypothetical protein
MVTEAQTVCKRYNGWARDYAAWISDSDERVEAPMANEINFLATSISIAGAIASWGGYLLNRSSALEAARPTGIGLHGLVV